MILDSTNVSSAVNEMDELELNNLALETAVYVAESWTDVMVGISQDEFKAYVESGEIQPMSEGALETVKNWIKKIWEKVKAFFSKVVAKIRGWLSGAKGFYDKYKKEIEAGASLVKDFKGYKYTGLDNAGDTVKKAVNTALSVSNFSDEKVVETTLKTLRKTLAGAEDSGEFHKGFVKYLRGSDSKETITLGPKELRDLLYSDIQIKRVTNLLQANEISFKSSERDAQIAAPEEANKEYNRKLSIIRSSIGVLVNANNIIVSTMNERMSMYRAYASAAVQAYKKDQSKNESTNLEGGSWQEYLKEQGIEL